MVAYEPAQVCFFSFLRKERLKDAGLMANEGRTSSGDD